MRPCSGDVNTLLPLLVRTHPQRDAAMAWWDRQPAGRWGSAGSSTLELLADERLGFWQEPAGFDDEYPKLLRYSLPTPGMVSDAYLAAFALARGTAVVSFDRGFRLYKGLDLELSIRAAVSFRAGPTPHVKRGDGCLRRQTEGADRRPGPRRSAANGFRSRMAKARLGFALSRSRGQDVPNIFPTGSRPARCPE